MSKKIIAGNWKQNGNLKQSINLTKNILAEVKKNKYKHEIIIFPPSLYLLETQKLNKDNIIKIGSQNVSAFNNGAYTGEISASMLKDSKIKYCLVGHSERRHMIYESDKTCTDKASRLYENNIKIIYCIGETLSDYKSKKTKAILKKQIQYFFNNIGEKINNKPNNIIFAYEPVWAIGTGIIPKKKELFETITFIKKKIKNLKVLYGGSVNSDNINQLKLIENIDGFLIGGASQDHKKFIDIIKKTYN